MAGSSMTIQYDDRGPIRKIIADWVSDDATGAVSGTTKKITGTLLKGVTDPDGDAAPTDDYDIVVTDEEGANVLGQCEDDLADRDTANIEVVQFLLANGAPAGVAAHPVVADKLTIAVSNAGNAKEGRLILYYRAA